ncbi:S8 family serine peptidase [Marinicella litoralis]|uniref:Immune inhibitor A peptidase M6 n=1 Tax=Marinicella litoralis TaxID=644220 RepID=A0A4R6Y0N9_9GAMM|nr:S8 family serine peptidase [Marinicella litoralis]TDR22488.1 immune inhibitor A peptidase M6 [Marinicella litoralis]
MKFKLKPLASAILLSSFSATYAEPNIIQQHQPSTEQIKQAINGNQLILSVGVFDPLTESLDFQQSGIAALPSQHYGLVQFQPGHANFEWLNKNGFKVLQSMSNNAYLVNWKDQDKTLLSQNNNIRWYGDFMSSYKISPNLWQANRSALTSFDIVVKTFRDYPTDQIKALIKKYVPTAEFIQSNIHQGDNRIAIQLSASDLDEKLNQLAALEPVQWINRYVAEKFANNEAVAAVQATSSTTTNRPIFDQGIFGTGQIVGVADSGLDRNEDWFVHHNNGSGVVTAITNFADTNPPAMGPLSPDNKVIAYWVMPGAEPYDSGTYHGTHVSGSVAGDRGSCIGSCNGETPSISSPLNSGYDNDDGMAPNAQILFQDIGSPSGLTGVGSSPMWEQANAAGAKIHSNSYGASTFGEYVSSDHNVDRSLRELNDMIIVFAAGNDDGFDNTTSSPGNAKSVLTVGALNHGNSSLVAGFSNRGLTDDGRLKPDISATGTSIQSAAGDSNNSNVVDSPSRRSTSGTSMATPITAGTLALLRQYFTDGFYPTGSANANDSLTPSGPLMKAMILNGTNTDVGFDSKDAGWGRPWLENTLPFTGSNRNIKFWDVTHDNGLSTGESTTFDVDVLAGEEFRATLVWYDVPGPTGSGVTLVNNLNLTVTTPGGAYLGNQFDLLGVSTTGGSADNINTVEQIRFTAPVTGSYQIDVSAPSIPGDGSVGSDIQGYALVVSGDLGSNSPSNIGNPNNLTAVADGLNGIDLNWNAATNATNYEVYRSDGSCASFEPGVMRYIGQSSTNSFTDDTTTGGYEYAYHVRAFNSDDQSALTNCTDVTSAQQCLLAPAFNALSATTSAAFNNTCQVNLVWDPATSNCPANSAVSYNIYRSSNHNFIPGPGNLLTSTDPNIASYTDYTVSTGANYFYRVSAVNNGNESSASPEIATSPIGTTSGTEGTLTDNGAADVPLLMNLTSPWSISNDASSNGALSYRSALEGTTNYTANTCARMHSPVISIPVAPGSNAQLSYQARYNIEADWDGVVVEISTDGGNNWSDLPPVGGYPGDFSQTGSPPINICGYPASHGAFNGSTGGSFNAVSHDLSAYHGETVQIRWSQSTDPGSEFEGFYIDEINYSNVNIPNVCSAFVDLIFADGFEGL